MTKDVPPAPDTERQPTFAGQALVEVMYSRGNDVRGIITVDSQGIYRVRTEFWDVRSWRTEHIAYWNQGLLDAKTDTLDNAACFATNASLRLALRRTILPTSCPRHRPIDR
jgi:hypothetical protein